MPVAYEVVGRPGLRLRVVDAGLACCAVEFAAAVHRGLLREVRPGGAPADADGAAGGAPGGPPALHVLVVSGTLTDVLAPRVRRAFESLPEPRAVLSYGACACTGGPYWDSYSVTKGVDQLVPVDVYVPGCPPRPEALVAALARMGAASGRAAPAGDAT